MRRVVLVTVFIGLALCLVGPIREGIGRWLSSSENFQDPEAKSQRGSGEAARRAPQPTTAPSENEDIQTAIQEYRLRSAKRVKQVQRALKQAGFDPGSIDGLIGHRTHAALIEFQKAHGLEPDGIVGETTWVALSASMRRGDVVTKQEPVRGE